MPRPRRYPLRTIFAYLTSPLLTGVVTWALLNVQKYLSEREGVYVRPFSMAFILLVVVMTAWGGWGPGLLTLALSVLATGYVLIEPHFSWQIQRPRDITELVGLAIVGSILVAALDLALRARRHSEHLLRESEEARERLQVSEERFRSLAAASTQMVWGTGPDGLIDDMPIWREYTGQTVDEVRGFGWMAAVHPEDRERVSQAWAQARETKSVYEADYRVCRHDGEYHYFFARGIPLLNTDGSVREWVGTWTDIHERRILDEERARHLRETEARAEREALLNRIGQAQRALDDPEAVQQIAVEELGRALSADRCYFAAYETERDRIHVGRDWRRPDLPSLKGEYRISQFEVDVHALHGSGQPLVISDIRDAALLGDTARQILEPLRLRAGLTVPLLDGGRIVATLSVAMADEPRHWTREDIALVQAVAAQTRSVMEVARLRLRERHIAERLQDALRPAIPAGIAGMDLDSFYRPALSEANIGGDFFDIFLAEKGCIALVVGDLSGKGLDAAAQVATVRNMLRYAVYRAPSLAAAVDEMNDILVEHNLFTGFATLFIGLYDTGAGSLTYVSCGHEPGLLRRIATGEVEELEATGPVLGAFADAPFSQKTIPVSSGDALAVFTDGLSEAGRSRYEFLGASALAALMAQGNARESAASLRQRIVQAVETHTDGAPHDDQCLLVAVVSAKG